MEEENICIFCSSDIISRRSFMADSKQTIELSEHVKNKINAQRRTSMSVSSEDFYPSDAEYGK